MGLVYLCKVTHTWRKDGHPFLHCVSNLNTLLGHQGWLCSASIMNAQGVISVCVSIWTHMDLNGWKLCTLDKISFCWVYFLFYDYFWNHQTIVLFFWTWKTICLNHALRTLSYCTGFDNCCNIIAIQRHDFAWAIHQVCTLSWDQTCSLDVKFRQHCCTWTQRWLVHVTSSQMNISVCLCIFYAIKLWSNSCTLVQLNWMGP